MDDGNKTALRHCRFLDDSYFAELYSAFIEAFSDYVVPFALTEKQFQSHIILNAVDLDLTIGCVENGRLIGFSLNGFGEWEGKSTVYDAGTGVIPAVRRQGVSRAMFEMMLPVFKSQGIEQCLLEVISNNTAAISLYKKLGFNITRELALLQCDGKIESGTASLKNVEVREIGEPDWDMFKTVWDGKPSWQNSIAAIKRSAKAKKALGAFVDGTCAGYIVFSSNFGRVAQLAVAPDHRNSGIGTLLLQKMQRETADGYSPQVINIDKSITGTMQFFAKHGFYERFSQYEMTKSM